MSTNAKHAKRSPGPASRRCFIQSSSPRLSRPPGRPIKAPWHRAFVDEVLKDLFVLQRVHWTPEAFVFKCHELVGFDLVVGIFRTRPGCAYRDRRRTELSSCLARVCRGSASRLGRIEPKSRSFAPDAFLRRVACVLACKCPGRRFHLMRGDHRGAHRFGPGTNRFAAGAPK